MTVCHDNPLKMTPVTELHAAVKRGDLPAMRRLLESDPGLANARSDSDARGTFPLHVAAEAGQAGAARLLLEYGADISAMDFENEASALGWAAFFGRPEVVDMLLAAGSAPSQRNKHGLTPLGCALGGVEGRWRKFSNATFEDWSGAADMIRAKGGIE
jgi:ankyrin repeat protein